MMHKNIVEQKTVTKEKLLPKFSSIHFSRSPVTSISTFYRSRILTTDIDINPLIAAAAGIFPLLHKIAEANDYNNLAGLHELLEHEIRAFEVRAQYLDNSLEQIILARYILCSTIDELILARPWGNNNWLKYRLLITFHHQAHGDENFYLILERLSENIAQNIHLLELLYVCFSFGYEGKYRTSPKGKEELTHIIESLYQKIRWQHGELKKNLQINNESLPEYQASLGDKLPVNLIALFFLAAILTVYTLLNYLLAGEAKPLYQQIHHILGSF